VRLEWSHHDGVDCLLLVGLAGGSANLRALTERELARRLPVYPSELVRGDDEHPGAVATGAVPQIGGRYVVGSDGVFFVPRYAFLDGTSYTLLVHRSIADSAAPTHHFDLEDYEQLAIERELPAGDATTRVIEIFPTAREIPRNQLKLYVQFSAPMSDDQVAGHVQVRRADTLEPLSDVLLPMDPELWDPAGARVTILFDPARIKRGLAPHRERGYPLEVGVPVEVVVDAGFRDADGRDLADVHVRRYDVGADVRARVDTRQWAVTAPKAGSTDSLAVEFDRPLDHALLQHCLGVVDAGGAVVAGRVRVGPGERSWQLDPVVPWLYGPYRLVVDAMLEDLAGNSLARVFDRELARSDHTPVGNASVIVDIPAG
jgi:hypothetical protein